MKFAGQKVSPHKQIYHQNVSVPLEGRNLNARIKSERCYMHYNNAVYMGGMISYKRNGQGVLLLDDGTSVLTDYCYDTMVGHNIIYGRNAIISVLFVKGSLYEIVYRKDKYIFQTVYNQQEHSMTGNGVLIDYGRKQIYHLIYSAGKVTKKIVQSNRMIIEEVFSSRLSKLINIKHQNALKFRVKLQNGVSIRIDKNKVGIGYTDRYDKLEGLGFLMQINQGTITNFLYPLEMKCLQRGYYSEGKLTNFGQKYFQNGNLYIGQFQNGRFDGKGLLIYPNESKWVYGFFEKQRLKKMFRMSIPNDDHVDRGELQRCIKQIHEFNTKNYMSVNVSIISWQYLSGKLQEAIFAETNAAVIEKQKVVTEQEERLYMIEEHFINQVPNDQIDRVMIKQMHKNKTEPEKVLLNEFSSLKPKLLQIQTKHTQNQSKQVYNNPYFSKKTLTPKTNKLKRDYRDHSEYQTYDSYAGLTPKNSAYRKETSPLKSGKSPFKKVVKECYFNKY